MSAQESTGRYVPTSVTPVCGEPRLPVATRSTTSARFGARSELAFLTAASHDLRDPLQIIASYVALLADGFWGPVNDDQRTSLMRLRGQVDYLSAVVGSVLALARMEQCGLELSNVQVPQVLAEVHELVEPFALARGVSLVIDCERAPDAVRAELTALRRVMVNLVGNAVKFAPRGGSVWLSARAFAQVVDLHVVDTGPGIPPAQIDAIFEPFVQGHPSDVAGYVGAGLGLAIARDLTRLMGGELFVRSAVGRGSVFTARLAAA
jgi:signal transduction histidine kinase